MWAVTATATADRRLMLVHAHPDDETIGNGVTMAKYVAEGAGVTLVTCTLGEEGEVLVPELEHLGADHDDDLGPTRLAELEVAMAALGVTDFVRLGGDYRFRDSGMAYDDQRRAVARDVLREGTFWTADLLAATNELVPLIRDRRPHVLVTYDEIGAYGHPDHVQAHRVTMYGYLLAGMASYRPDLGEPWSVPRLLWNTMSRARMREAVARLRAAGDTESFADWGLEPDDPPPGPEDIAVEITSEEHVPAKLTAMRAHATQITEDGPFFAGTAVLGHAMWATEHYRLVAGTPFPAADGPADDLFAGLV
ncbi:N-acetyl-1-D-myo-inositol-2-amino-2-deoxy-alpha-D -glucopyranoside deacetylase [Microlunatus lacustris]